jgi:hypothetical protein
MSIPVEDWEPLIGPSTAITPALGDPVVELEDEQPAAIIAPTASETAAPTRDGESRTFKRAPPFPSAMMAAAGEDVDSATWI